MRKPTISALVLLVTFSRSLTLYAQDTQLTTNTLTVYGIGTIDVPPDRAFIAFTLEGYGPSLSEAFTTARDRVQSITTKLLSLGLKQGDILTSTFYGAENIGGKAFLSASHDYRTNIDMRVTVDGLDLIQPILTALADAQVDRISNIQFVVRADSLLKLQARGLAAANARQKALLMAQELDIALGRAIYVEELLGGTDSDFNVSRPPNYNFASAAVVVNTTPSVLFRGKMLNVKSGVKVVYEIARK